MHGQEEFWQCLQTLHSKPKWLFGSAQEEEKLAALNTILEIGLPRNICNLIPFLKSENVKIRDRTCDVIIALCQKIVSKKDLYENLKYCEIDISDIDHFKYVFPEDKFHILLTIASLNKSGYVREKAVKLLGNANDDQAIPFLIYRLADWVERVRKAASLALAAYKIKEFLPVFIAITRSDIF